MPSSSQPKWKSTRSSSGPRRRTSNTEVNYAPLLLIPLAQIPAGFWYGAGGFYDARNISTAGPSSARPGPGKGTSRETPDFLSHDTGRWTLHLLQRGRVERRADASPVARTPVFLADVRASLRPAFRSLSPCRARLPRLRTQ